MRIDATIASVYCNAIETMSYVEWQIQETKERLEENEGVPGREYYVKSAKEDLVRYKIIMEALRLYKNKLKTVID